MGEACFEGDEAALWVRASGDVYRDSTLLWKNDVTEGYRGDSVRATQQHFADCLRSGAPFESSPEEYLKTVRVVEAAYESLASRQFTSV
jgi:predicted dehydrogenase